MTDAEDRAEERQASAWLMLTTRAAQLEVGSKSFDSLSPSLVAAMLAGLPERPFAAGMLCEAGDWLHLPRVASFLYYDTIEIAAELEWPLPRGPQPLRNLVYLALIEATGPSVICTSCGGEQKQPTHVEGQHRPCRLCEGRGRLPALQESRAGLIGVDESNWRKTWRDRYLRVDQLLQSWRLDARDHLKDALAGRRPRKQARSPITA